MSTSSHEHFLKSLQKLTDQRMLQTNLVNASLYLTAFEVLKSTIVDQIRDFYSREIGANDKSVESPEYIAEMRGLHKNRFIASCLWLQQNDVISEVDMEEILLIRDHRNHIAHELVKFLVDVSYEIDKNKLEIIRKLLAKIDRWWVMEVHIPVNADFDNEEIDETQVNSGRMIIIDAIFNIISRTTE